MADKLNPKVVSLSLVAVSITLSLVCALLIALAPDTSLKFFGSIFHGIDITKIATTINASDIITGLVAISATAFASGWLFATVYNYLSDRL